VSYDFDGWDRKDLRRSMMYIENSPRVVTYGPAMCGHGNTRGCNVCWKCCMAELQKRLGYADEDLSDIKVLKQFDSYHEKRGNNCSHNIALMLALKQGAPGYCHPPAAGTSAGRGSLRNG